ncbi:BPI fold-containing family B member 6 isoform X3 [Manis pentadactyla]|uniref:BPI fold-containing family B member 6 isoform X3 n=1 Tax=Manis pentadactyla TaxID=143292 RepID=UPI00255CD113|nr:BPI fold-containing family B member 6 isoform X3 [Manis pentadactyla]
MLSCLLVPPHTPLLPPSLPLHLLCPLPSVASFFPLLLGENSYPSFQRPADLSPPPRRLPLLFPSWPKPHLWFLQLFALIMALVTHFCHCWWPCLPPEARGGQGLGVTHLWVSGSPSPWQDTVNVGHLVEPPANGLGLGCLRAWPGAGKQWGPLVSVSGPSPFPEVQSAMDESHILEKMAAEAGKKRPGMKPIKGITNLKVKDVQLPVITLNFIPGVGIFQCVSTGMTITGKSFMGGNMEIILVLNITATNRLLQDEASGLPVFKSEGCEVILVSMKTKLPSSMPPKVVNKLLDSTLRKVLPTLLCPAINAVLVYVNRKWANLNVAMPVGQMGTVKYALASTPTTTASYFQVDFSPVVQLQEGTAIQLAEAGEALELPEGYAEGSSQLLLSATLLTAELALLQKSFDVNIQDKTTGELPSQTTETLAGFIPEVAEAYPKPKPLVTQIRINKPPRVTMKTGKSLLHLHGTLEMFAARRRHKAPVSLFRLETHL